MKVTQVLYSGLGGHGSVAFSIIGGDIHKKHDFSMVFQGIEPLIDDYKKKCAKLQIPYQNVHTKSLPLLINWFKSFLAIVKQKPNVVLLHSINLVALVPILRIIGIKVIAIDHTSINAKSKKDWIYLKLSLFLCRHVVFLTDSHASEIQKMLNKRLSRSEYAIINNGIDTHLYSPKNLLSTLPPPFIFMMQGRFTPVKDFYTLITAVNLLKKQTGIPFKVRLAGDGETKSDCERLVNQLQIDDIVSFEGMLNEQEMVNLIAQTHVYVHSSHSEAMSTAVMQAMAAGKPVIASDIAGMQNLIAHQKTGLLFEESNAQQLAELLAQCINGSIDITRLAQSARTFAEERLSMEQMFSKYDRLISN